MHKDTQAALNQRVADAVIDESVVCLAARTVVVIPGFMLREYTFRNKPTEVKWVKI